MTWRRLLLVAAAGLCLPPAGAHASGRCGVYTWCDAALAPAARAALMLGAMSQADKVALLRGAPAPDVGLPGVYFVDGPLGVGGLGNAGRPATAMPAGIALAAAFDPVLAVRYGAVVGVEAEHRGYDGVLGPTVNIMRTPLGGRTFEGYGEDPFLAGQTAVGWIDGLQATGAMATVKHFAANNQEGEPTPSGLLGDRMRTNVEVDPRELAEIELPPFEAAVSRAHTASLMCAYNLVNGPYACASPYLLSGVLRQRWGFDGFVVADAGASHDTAAGLAAGLDNDGAGTSLSPAAVDAALAAGTVSTGTLDARVLEVLRTLFAHGFLDRAAYPIDPGLDDRVADQAVADATAEQGSVLLENAAGVLPLNPANARTIAVIGSAAAQYIHGDGSSAVTPYATTTVLAGIQARAARAGIAVTYDDGSNQPRAAALARAANVAVVVAADAETEGADRLCLSLEPQCTTAASAPLGNQDGLIAAVAAANPKTVVVLETGAPVLTPWRGAVAALLEGWYPGQDGGGALAAVLFGDADPGGRLPVTFPAAARDIPTAAGGAAVYPGVLDPASGVFDVHYAEGVLVGYRSYDARRVAPAFAFGAGLSYTTFGLRDLRASPTAATLTVTNTGRRAGWAVPELYVGLPSTAGVPEPPRQLAGFAKAMIGRGAVTRVSIPLSSRSFSYWDDATSTWRVAPGCDTVWVGSSSRALALSARVAPGGLAPRAVSIGLPASIRNAGIRSVTVYVGGRRVRTLRGACTTVRVTVGAVTEHVRLAVSTRRGERRFTRAVSACP